MFTISETKSRGLIPCNDYYLGFSEQLTNVPTHNGSKKGYLEGDNLVTFKHNAPFAWELDISSDNVNHFFDIAVENATQMVASHERITLLVSGGIDSEMLLRTFHSLASYVDVVFFDYGYNFKDKQDLKNTIPPEYTVTYINIDALNFFKKDLHLGYGLRYRTSFPEVMLFMYSLELVRDGRHLVISGDIPEPSIVQNQFKFAYPSDNIVAIERWARANDTSITPSFLMSSKIQSDVMHTVLLNNKYNTFSYQDKQILYDELGYNGIQSRDAKLTGLEEIRRLHAIWNFSVIIEDFKQGVPSAIVMSFLKTHYPTLIDWFPYS